MSESSTDVSITYVERLEGAEDPHAHAHSHDAFAPHDSLPNDHAQPHKPSHCSQHERNKNSHSVPPEHIEAQNNASLPGPVTERTGLLRTASTPAAPSGDVVPAKAVTYTIPAVEHSAPGAVVPVFFPGHHRFEQPSVHSQHSAPSARVIARRSTMLGGVVRPNDRNGAASYFSSLFRHPHAHAGHSHSRHLHHHDEDLYDSSGAASGTDNDRCSGQDVDCEVGRHDEHIIAVDVGKRRPASAPDPLALKRISAALGCADDSDDDLVS